jgi:predicted SprT family Zn-dependent metalloprotease
MKVVRKDWINVQVKREVAESLLKAIANSPALKEIKKQIKEELSPSYEYQVRCGDCPRVFTVTRKTKLSDKEPIEGGLCVSCSDDYK